MTTRRQQLEEITDLLDSAATVTEVALATRRLVAWLKAAPTMQQELLHLLRDATDRPQEARAGDVELRNHLTGGTNSR